MEFLWALDCFLTSFGSGLGVGFTKKAGLSAGALAAFSFVPKLKQAWLFLFPQTRFLEFGIWCLEFSPGPGLISSFHLEIGLRGSFTKKAIRLALQGFGFSFFCKLGFWNLEFGAWNFSGPWIASSLRSEAALELALQRKPVSVLAHWPLFHLFQSSSRLGFSTNKKPIAFSDRLSL
ncbi:hypothetical protein [Muriicola jejuensis]|uniref:Uncharacterized protein n=1 Tax=Muriicola jejuensis TaxID=504488 RepID=A0A6P0UFB3_9FLAO|nr:hypothetical protein [Muriicola jejuensis]NER11707.1 hypothetical protein [Muriicola jejuensis]